MHTCASRVNFVLNIVWFHLLVENNIIDQLKLNSDMILAIMLFILGLSVKCYLGVEPEGERWKACDLERGFRTCYSKYDVCKFILSC